MVKWPTVAGAMVFLLLFFHSVGGDVGSIIIIQWHDRLGINKAKNCYEYHFLECYLTSNDEDASFQSLTQVIIRNMNERTMRTPPPIRFLSFCYVA
jgi:hypothetical protein